MTIGSTISGVAGVAASAIGGPVVGAIGGSAAKAGGSAFAAILDELKKVGAQTPMERARDAVLKKHGLTDDQYNALPATDRSAIDKEIADAARKVAEAQMQPKRADGRPA